MSDQPLKTLNMTPILLIASAIALLAFSHGVVILGKASRENHGSIYKIAGWFVIVAAFFIMGCTLIHSAIGAYRWPYMHGMMEMRGRHTMNWFRGNDYSPDHRYYDYDNDVDDRDYDRTYRRNRDNGDNYSEPRNRNYSGDTSRTGRYNQ